MTRFTRLLSLATCLAATPAAADEPKQLWVLDLVVDLDQDDETDARVAKDLHEMLLAEFQNVAGYQVLGWSDITAMLDKAQQERLIGCKDSEKCLMELAGALGAELLAVPRIGEVGGRYLINVKILNTVSHEATVRDYETVPGVEVGLLCAVQKIVRKQFGRELSPECMESPLPPPTDESILSKWWFWTAAAAVVGVGVGVAVVASRGDQVYGWQVNLPAGGE